MHCVTISDMLKEYRLQTRLCAWGGLAFLGLAYFMAGLEDDGWVFFSRLLYLGGYALTGCGTYMFGRGKVLKKRAREKRS